MVFGEEAVEVNGGATRIPWQPINTLPEEERVLLYFPKTEGGPQVISGVRVHRHILTGIDYSGEDWGGGGNRRIGKDLTRQRGSQDGKCHGKVT